MVGWTSSGTPCGITGSRVTDAPPRSPLSGLSRHPFRHLPISPAGRPRDSALVGPAGGASRRRPAGAAEGRAMRTDFSGRPAGPGPAGETVVEVVLLLPAVYLNALERQARQDGWSRATLLRRIIARFLAARGQCRLDGGWPAGG